MEPHQLAHATFTISGDRVMPEFWTSYFSVTPEMAIVKGEVFTTSAGKTSRLPTRTVVSGVRSNSAI
mgnify:FL=1